MTGAEIDRSQKTNWTNKDPYWGAPVNWFTFREYRGDGEHPTIMLMHARIKPNGRVVTVYDFDA